MAKIRELAAGSLINFSGREWVLLNPTTGYIVTKLSITSMKANTTNNYSYFDPLTVGSSAYYLNNSFYNSLTDNEKSIVKSRVWNVGFVNTTLGGYANGTPSSIATLKSYEDNRQVIAKVGLLSISDWYSYGAIFDGAGGAPYRDGTMIALLTPTGASEPTYFFAIGLYSRLTTSVYNQDNEVYQAATQENRIFPTLEIDPTAEVINGVVTYNSIPSTTLTTSDNRTLYENDTLNIAGSVSEADIGNTVTARYQLNAEPARAIKAFISTGAIEAFSKSLTFKAGKLFDGETAVTGVLADGVAHNLTVYATDDQGGTSPIVERTFYVVPNRAPALTVNTVTPSGIIDTDAFDISGSYSDQDGNTTTVRYKINGSNPAQIAQGTNGAWSFTLPLGKLAVGENTIVIEAEDTYGAKTSKTVKLRKQEVKTAIETGVARYKIEPPTGTAKEVMLWIQHDANLTLDTAISMTQAAEAETYVPMSLTTTATLSNGQVESEFYYNASAAKENILVQITQTKTSADANEKITLISGVL